MCERKWNLDLIRIIACFFVIVVHVTGYGMEIKDPMSEDWMIRNFVACLVRCAVPVFFMLSGILFMEKEISIKVLYKKYISRLVIAWVIWSAFYAAIDFVAYMKNGEGTFGYFIVRFLAGHYHLWFLPSLLVAYLFLPITQTLIRFCQPRLMIYLGGIILFGIIVKETLDPFVQLEGWDNIWNNLAIPGGSSGIIYFVLGYYLYKNRHILTAKSCLLGYLLSAGLMGAVNMLSAWHQNMHVTVTYGYLSIGVLISSMAFFLFVCKKLSGIHLGEMQKKMIRSLSDCTFGIYLFHTLLIEQVYRRIGLTQEQFPTFISIVIFSIITFVVSYIVVWCVRKIPVLGKILM